jgi:hypothetical protein
MRKESGGARCATIEESRRERGGRRDAGRGLGLDYSFLLLIELIGITIFGRREGREGPSNRRLRKSDPIFLGNFRNPLADSRILFS